jgi:hypothetical protein
MRLSENISIFGGGPGSGCNPEVGHCGRHGNESHVFVSPNIKENTSFADAQKALRSDDQARFRSLVEDRANQLYGKANVKSGMGDWSDGAEGSVVVEAHGSFEKAKYLGALSGRDGNQKAVIAFHAEAGGSSTLYRFESSEDVQTVRKAMDSNGVQFRTIVPTRTGVQVLVFDSDNSIGDNISHVAKELKTEIQGIPGRGSFIGGDTRSQGLREFEKVIDQSEQAHQD